MEKKDLILVDNLNDEELFQIKGGANESRDIVICIGNNSGKGKDQPDKPDKPKDVTRD